MHAVVGLRMEVKDRGNLRNLGNAFGAVGFRRKMSQINTSVQ
jgi:hypothetical protein